MPCAAPRLVSPGSSPTCRPFSSATIRSIRLLALGCLSGCDTTLTVRELDALNRSLEVSTIVVEPAFSLYSPFDAEHSEAYARVIGQEIGRVSTLFGLEGGTPVVALLEPLEGLGPSFFFDGERVSVRIPREHPMHGIGGMASEEGFVVYVPPTREIARGPDGTPIRWRAPVEEFRGTIRHEVAHVCVRRLGIRGKLWLTEGFAEEIERMLPDGASLALSPLPAGIEISPGRAESSGLVRRILEMEQDAEKIARGEAEPDLEGRLFARALVRFALERRGTATFAEVARRLDAMRESEIEALEPALREWLEALAASGLP